MIPYQHDPNKKTAQLSDLEEAVVIILFKSWLYGTFISSTIISFETRRDIFLASIDSLWGYLFTLPVFIIAVVLGVMLTEHVYRNPLLAGLTFPVVAISGFNLVFPTGFEIKEFLWFYAAFMPSAAIFYILIYRHKKKPI